MRFPPSDAAVRLWCGCTWVNGQVSVSSDEMINPVPHHHVPQESHSEWRPGWSGRRRTGSSNPRAAELICHREDWATVAYWGPSCCLYECRLVDFKQRVTVSGDTHNCMCDMNTSSRNRVTLASGISL